MMSRTIKTPRADGATLGAAFTVSDIPEGVRCEACNEHVGPSRYHECWNPPASVDTVPKGGDVEQAPAPLSGAVGDSRDAQ